jgi:phosphoribosyl 1,2-cyclic phosphate phosphodiesterase
VLAGDFGPDVLAASQMYNAPLYDLEHLLLTHTHEDHLSFANLGVLTMTPRRDGKTLYITLSPAACRWVEGVMAAAGPLHHGYFPLATLVENGKVALRPAPLYTPFTLGAMEVFAVESNHPAYGEGERALNYRVCRPGRPSILYICDSGLYSQENCRALAGQPVDILVMEATLGDVDVPREQSHLNGEHFVENLENFLHWGVISDQTRVYATHINQVQRLDHEQYQRFFVERSPVKVTVARDGLRCEE